MTDKDKAWFHALKTEWVFDGERTIRTKDVFCGYHEYRNDGKLKKNAKKRQQQILFHYLGNAKHILEQICLEHNWYVNRKNKDAQKQILEDEVKRATNRLRFFLD